MLQAKNSKDKNLDGVPTRRAGEPETFSSVRSMKHKKAAKSQQHSAEANKAQHTPPTSSSGAEATTQTTPG